MKEKNSRHLLVHLILILGSFIMILPFAWMVLTAFKTQNEAIPRTADHFSEPLGSDDI